MLIDVHCHLTDERFKTEMDGVVREASEQGVGMVTAGTSPSDSQNAVILAEKYSSIWACVGIHPEEVNETQIGNYKSISGLIDKKKVVGIGEVGLDYRSQTKEEDREKQKVLFRMMLDMANSADLPVVVHNRNADEDILKILDEYRDIKVLMHCFTRGREFMKKCAEREYYMSFGGLVTYENNSRMKMVVKEVPIELLLIETDAPYSVPAGVKRPFNSPVNVKIVAEEIAGLRKLPVTELETVAEANTRKLFNKIK